MTFLHLRPYLYAICAVSFFGLMSPLLKELITEGEDGKGGVSELLIPSARLTGGAVLMWLWFLLRQARARMLSRQVTSLAEETSPSEGEKLQRLERGDLKDLCCMACLGFVANFYLFIYGHQFISASLATIIAASTPILVLIMRWLIDRKSPQLGTMLGVGVGFAGVGAFTMVEGLTGGQSSTSELLLGVGLCVTSQISFAVFSVRYERTIRKYESNTLLRYLFTLGAIIASPVLLVELLRHDIGLLLRWENLLNLSGVIVLGTFMSYILYTKAQQYFGAEISVFTALIPIVSYFVSILYGQEQSLWLKWGFAAVVIGAAIYVARRVAPVRCSAPSQS